ncbi:S41 family peptidase [Pacificimonas flava]|uniref:Carboxyl-terminal protease n=1 Tax=Pacificimonas flava TaxID=1234595 RepID=M2S8N8_9SPHN|nr:S41 family peptidase [Pacificimonas flava]EMD81740.1 Carboxyl-terminal protease [Pacificimonas flava]MBB5279310.1 carboxyl-terminal processing protease [Pacificimonas flava]
MKHRILYAFLPMAMAAVVPTQTSVLAQDAPAEEPTETANATDTYRQLDQLMDVFERVRAEYVEEVSDEKLIEGAIQGMLTSLDPHSSYLNVSDFDRMRTQTDGEYGGLGLTVSMEDNVVRVVAPTDDTPAARAGIKAGDYITHIDGELIYGLTLNEAVDQMRGAPGTPIELTIVRDGEDEPLELTLTRETIELKPVKWEVQDDVGILRISTFNKQTGPATRQAIAAIAEQEGNKLLGYVIDLRSNPGGLLDQAIEVSDVFLKKGGEIVSQRGREASQVQRYFSRDGDMTNGKPVVVLVDQGSASASEIVAGALQDHRRALVVGSQSFGKGSVQTLIPLGTDTALRLTTARYYTPSGRSVQEEGIEPDITVPQLSDEHYADRHFVREADLRRALRNESIDNDKLIEDDDKPNPRFDVSYDELKEQGIEDYQMHYAVDMLHRLEAGPGAPVQTARADR